MFRCGAEEMFWSSDYFHFNFPVATSTQRDEIMEVVCPPKVLVFSGDKAKGPATATNFLGFVKTGEIKNAR